MIVFSRPPGWKRRADDPGSAGGFAEASVGTSTLRSGSDCPPCNSGRREGRAAAACLREADASLPPPEVVRRAGRRRQAEDGSSSGGDALRRPRKATLRAALQDLTLTSRGPCDASGITADHAPSRKTRKAVRCVTVL